MYKILFGVIALASYISLDVLADGKLQEMSHIVKNMNNTRLCDRDCVPVVTVDGTVLTIAFKTKITDGVDTNAVCECMKDYMKSAVGDATAACEVKENEEFFIVFSGDYDATTKPLPPLTSLSNILANYEEPDFGGYKCTKEISEQDGRTHIEITYRGKEYQTACAGILYYLNQNKVLDGTSSKCTESERFEKAVLNLWASE